MTEKSILKKWRLILKYWWTSSPFLRPQCAWHHRLLRSGHAPHCQSSNHRSSSNTRGHQCALRTSTFPLSRTQFIGRQADSRYQRPGGGGPSSGREETSGPWAEGARGAGETGAGGEEQVSISNKCWFYCKDVTVDANALSSPPGRCARSTPNVRRRRGGAEKRRHDSWPSSSVCRRRERRRRGRAPSRRKTSVCRDRWAVHHG